MEPERDLDDSDIVDDEDLDEVSDTKVSIKEMEQDESLLLRNNNINEEILSCLEKRGIDRLFPIQKAVFDPIRAGKDIIGRAKTGSGKTLAFAVPIIESILDDYVGNVFPRGRTPKAIVIVPTRELAKQVESEITSCTKSLSLCVCYGGTPEHTQVRQLEKGVDIVVGTPGRLMDLMSPSRGKNRGSALNLEKIKHVVLDESDQMLDMGFSDDIEDILKGIPDRKDVQTLLFSATLPGWVRNIAKKFQKSPQVIDLVGEENTGKLPDSITALAMECQLDAKPQILRDVIQVYARDGKIIIFTNTKRECDIVYQMLGVQYNAGVLHGDKSQNDRDRVMKGFKAGKIQILVATDVAARGLDIPNVEVVIHYELPQDGEAYLHRSGRTGRAGKEGVSILLVEPDEQKEFRRIVNETNTDINLAPLPGPEEIIQAASSQVYKTLANVNMEVAKYFQEPAEKMLEVGDNTMVLATALAALSGHVSLPKRRSLLSQEEGYITMKLESPRIDGSRMVLGVIGSVAGKQLAGELGKISIYKEEDSNNVTAVFDVPDGIDEELLQLKEQFQEQGVDISLPKTLPVEISSSYSSSQRMGRGGRQDRQFGNRQNRGRGGYGGDRGGYGGGGGGGRGGYGGGNRDYQSRGRTGGGGGYQSGGGGGYQSGGGGGYQSGGGGGYQQDRGYGNQSRGYDDRGSSRGRGGYQSGGGGGRGRGGSGGSPFREKGGSGGRDSYSGNRKSSNDWGSSF